MAGLFVQLKLRLLTGGFRKSTGQMVGFILGAVFAVCLGALGCFLLAVLRGQGRTATDIGVVVFTAFALGWGFLPLLHFGTDETLDPSRLALLPLNRRRLITGLFVASLVGTPPVATLLVLAGGVVGLSGGAGSILVGVVAAALELALCVTFSRALTCALSGLLRSRRGRDLAVFAGLAIVVGIQGLNLAAQYLAGWDVGNALTNAARVLRWTPSGLAAHAIGDARGGDYLTAVGELAATAGTVALLLWWWTAALTRALVVHDASTQGAVRPHGRLGPTVGALLPTGRVGAVAAKELRYVWREPRRKVGLASSLWPGVIIGFSFATNGGGLRAGALIAVSFIALLLGLQAANQFGLDGAATWMNVMATSEPRDMRADLAGRNLAHAMIGVPLLLIVSGCFGAFARDLGQAVTAFAVGCGVLGVSLGLSSVTSVLLPYPVPERRTNVFSGGNAGRGCLTAATAWGTMLASAVLALPVILPAAFFGAPATVPLLVLAPAYGAGIAWAGRRIATAVAFPHLPELLAKVSTSV